MPTVLDLLTDAMAEIGAVAQGETLSANDADFCFRKLNRLVGQWNTRRLYVYVIDRAEYTFGTSKQSYTIGPSAADFTAARPVRIEAANLVIVGSDNARLPLWVLNTGDYAALNVPGLSSTIPTRLYYQPTNPNGTLWPWPYPTVTTNKLELFTWHQISEFTQVAETIALPPGYQDALTYALAEALSPAYGKKISDDLRRISREATSAIQSANVVTPTMTTDIYPTGGEWDYRTGGMI